MFELAARTLEEALKEKLFSTKKRRSWSITRLGCSSDGQTEEAIKQLEEILRGWISVTKTSKPAWTHIIPGSNKEEQFWGPFCG